MIAARRIVQREGGRAAAAAPNGGDTAAILDGVDLQIVRGHCVVISSHARDSASVLLRILAGLLPPTSGVIEIDGQNLPAARNGRPNIAFADGWVDPAGELTAGEFLLASGCAASAAARAGVGARTPLRRLSAGDRRALSAASALGSTRELLILDRVMPDDPAAPLFAWARERIAGGAAVITTGTAIHAAALGGRHLHLERGRLS